VARKKDGKKSVFFSFGKCRFALPRIGKTEVVEDFSFAPFFAYKTKKHLAKSDERIEKEGN
jgi:hypothetical protein